MHLRDENTKWFGVRHGHDGQLVLEDFGRYTSVFATEPAVLSHRHRQYPQLVSFIGSTNAGKSSLVRALIARAGSYGDGSMPEFSSPVVGSPLHDSVPTSGDVHLYGDPSTVRERYPLLFADCEGLEGGERLPAGPKICRSRFSWESGDESAVQPTRQRPLRWACTEQMNRREFAVTNLYPRILYAFSDCIVFVLKNPKTFQSIALTKLLDWAAVAMERSMNRATRPHCVVVLNASDVGLRNEDWDVEHATKTLLADVEDALDPVRGVPKFRMLADRWRHLGKRIDTAQDLILCFYSSFRAIRVPSTPHYRAIDRQIGRLDDVLREACRGSADTKRRIRMLLTAEEQQVYLSRCFDHYASRLDTAFDFTQVALRDRPIAQGFDRHALEFIVTLSKRASSVGTNDTKSIFRSTCALFASYILVDCVRFRKGGIEVWFSHYALALQRVMDEYRQFHHLCSYRSSDGTRSCLLVRAYHGANCHQDGTGVIANGEYLDDIDDPFVHEWLDGIRATVKAMGQTLSWRSEQLGHDDTTQEESEMQVLMDMHLTQLGRVFELLGPPSDIRSVASCFACLTREAEHPLPCGHVLCDGCARAHGVTHRYTVSLQYCPLHSKGCRWDAPLVIACRPRGAGIRVLSLDGGGIRGIVQLEVLRAIERALDDLIPVQKFFDLIVGTGTGGLNAVSLALADTSIGRCMETLYTVCEALYAPRQRTSALMGQVARSLGALGSHKTGRLDAALRAAFTRDARFFGAPGQFAQGARAAVVAGGDGGGNDRPLLITNYRRLAASSEARIFEGRHGEVTTWESVRATLTKHSRLRAFAGVASASLDGSTASANPSVIAHAEAKLLHSDQDVPDLVLSLGTGQDRQRVLRKLTQRGRSGDTEARLTQSRAMKHGRRFSRVDAIVEAEVEWQLLKASDSKGTHHEQHNRLIRLNPDMSHSVPSADDRASMQNLQSRTRQKLGETHRLAVIHNVAHRLLATAFFVETRPQTHDDRILHLYPCQIACRFQDGSKELRAVGELLQRRHVQSFSPYFSVRQEDESSPQGDRIFVTAAKAAQMSYASIFCGFDFNIRHNKVDSSMSICLILSAHDALQPEGYPISGFPRTITKAWLNACVDPEPGNPGMTNSRASAHVRNRRVSDTDLLDNKDDQPENGAMDRRFSPTSSIDDPFHLCSSRHSTADTSICEHDSLRSNMIPPVPLMGPSNAPKTLRRRHSSAVSHIASQPTDQDSNVTLVSKVDEPFTLHAPPQSAEQTQVRIDATNRPRLNPKDEISPLDDVAWLKSELLRERTEKQRNVSRDNSIATRQGRRHSEDSIISYFVDLLSQNT